MIHLKKLVLLTTLWGAKTFNIADYTHYIDYLPERMEGVASWYDDFRTAAFPPSHLRNRKMEIGNLKVDVEEVLANPVWPSRWPYGFEDFRPLDYTRTDIMNLAPQYEVTQSLLEATTVTIIPGILRLPVKRHFVMPKDKFALTEHMSQHFFDGAKVLELFSTYESILPENFNLGPTVGVGLYAREMQCNPELDDFIEQDISVDPYLPLADNYFDFVVVPAMFQLFQRPKEMFQEINRVLKPGGRVFIGVKLVMWAFLGWKQGRYYVETNYLEDVLAAGSFLHYAEGYTKPQSYDLTLPELNPVGKFKDTFFPSPRLDFYACVEAKKKKNSIHGQNTIRDETVPEIEGKKFMPKTLVNEKNKREYKGPYY